MNKVLMKITEGAYSVRIAGNDRTTDAMVRGVLNSDCSFYDAREERFRQRAWTT